MIRRGSPGRLRPRWRAGECFTPHRPGRGQGAAAGGGDDVAGDIGQPQIIGSRNAVRVHPPGAPADPRGALSAVSLDAAKITVIAAALGTRIR
jgi:hypothetical protein